MRLSITALLVISLFGASPASAQNLKLPVSNYTNQVYGRKYDATNRCLITDHRNFIYTGNANGILEYDGGEWRFIPVRQGAYITSLSADSKGVIYVGSQNEFGLLEADVSGDLVYFSISDSLDEFDRFFSVVWATHSADERVYFQSEEILFIYHDGAIIPVYPESSFHTSFLVGQKLYVRERSKGLMVLDEEELKLVNGGSDFAETGIFAMFPMDNSESVFIATREKGFYSWHPEKGISKVHSDNEEFLIKSGITGGITPK